MPVDLDDQLHALGHALMRDSAPITVDELGLDDVVMRRSEARARRLPTRRRWATAAAVATVAASAVAIVAVGARDVREVPAPADVASPSTTAAVAPAQRSDAFVGVRYFPLLDAAAVGLSEPAEATFGSHGGVSASGTDGAADRGAWTAVLGKPDANGVADVTVVMVHTGLVPREPIGHVATGVTESANATEYSYRTDDLFVVVTGDVDAGVAEGVFEAIVVDDQPGLAGGFDFATLPDALEVVTPPFAITDEAGHFPVLAFPEVTITVNPAPALGVLASPGRRSDPINVAGRTTFVSEGGQGLVDLASELDDGTSLTLSTASLSVDRLVEIAEAIRLVDEPTWIRAYAPSWTDGNGQPVALPPEVTVEVTTTGEPAVTRALSDGMAGGDVALLQERLISLGFDPGPADGVYGAMTSQAVWAFEKLAMGVPRAEATGAVTPEMWARMQEPVTIAPRRPQDAGVDHVEIYLPEQVMVVFHDDQAVLITHISTGELNDRGEPAHYCETIQVDTDPNGNPLPEPEEQAICGIAKTPGGIFDVDRFVPGTRVSPLGAMWNPIDFNYGIAIHGAKNVPLEPASHGNVRVPMHVSERLPELIDIGDTVYVWDGKKEPEDQTREDELPVFDWNDPNA